MQMEMTYQTHDHRTGITHTEHVNTDLSRVSSKIAPYILDFFKPLFYGQQFYAEDVLNHVQEKTCCAPDSVSRIMRMLKRSGQLNYRVVNRSQSLYEALQKV